MLNKSCLMSLLVICLNFYLRNWDLLICKIAHFSLTRTLSRYLFLSFVLSLFLSHSLSHSISFCQSNIFFCHTVYLTFSFFSPLIFSASQTFFFTDTVAFYFFSISLFSPIQSSNQSLVSLHLHFPSPVSNPQHHRQQFQEINLNLIPSLLFPPHFG